MYRIRTSPLSPARLSIRCEPRGLIRKKTAIEASVLQLGLIDATSTSRERP